MGEYRTVDPVARVRFSPIALKNIKILSYSKGTPLTNSGKLKVNSFLEFPSENLGVDKGDSPLLKNNKIIKFSGRSEMRADSSGCIHCRAEE